MTLQPWGRHHLKPWGYDCCPPPRTTQGLYEQHLLKCRYSEIERRRGWSSPDFRGRAIPHRDFSPSLFSVFTAFLSASFPQKPSQPASLHNTLGVSYFHLCLNITSFWCFYETHELGSEKSCTSSKCGLKMSGIPPLQI